MKKFAIVILIVFTFTCSAFAAPAVNIVIDGSSVEFTNDSGAPFIDSNNRTLVPMRVVMEKYGCTVQWSQSTKTASVVLGDTTVIVPIGQAYITVNGEQRAIDAPAQVVSGRTYLPIRAVLEAFGAGVGWDNASKSVIANSDGTVSNKAEQGSSVGDKQGADSANSDAKMSYDEFIGLFDIEEHEPELISDENDWYGVSFRQKNNITDSEIYNLIHQDYAKRYIYNYLRNSNATFYRETGLWIRGFLYVPFDNVGDDKFTFDEFLNDFNIRLRVSDEESAKDSRR